MLEAVARIETLTTGKSLDDYRADWATRDAVERNLERVSEASRHVPDDLKGRHSNVAWRLVADLGNVLRHAYDQVIDERVWQIVTSDLASLKAAVEAMLQELGGTDPGGTHFPSISMESVETALMIFGVIRSERSMETRMSSGRTLISQSAFPNSSKSIPRRRSIALKSGTVMVGRSIM
jgi:uncharacterized protein with HEPN domain